MARRTITVESSLVQMVDEWAKAKGCTKDEAYDRFMTMSISRSNALARYAKGGSKPAKKAKAKPAKKARAKKAAPAAAPAAS